MILICSVFEQNFDLENLKIRHYQNNYYGDKKKYKFQFRYTY